MYKYIGTAKNAEYKVFAVKVYLLPRFPSRSNHPSDFFTVFSEIFRHIQHLYVIN